MNGYERLTPRDWHDAKFAQLDQRVVLKRLWDLENQIEQSSTQHYYIINGKQKTQTFGGTTEYTDTYVICEGYPSELAVHFGVYDNKVEAEARAEELNKHPYKYWVDTI